MRKPKGGLSRRSFLITGAAAATAGRVGLSLRPAARPVLRLAYDKSLGMMRAIDRLVP